MVKQQQRLSWAGAVLLAVMLATPAAAGRQLAGANRIKGGKGPRYAVFPVAPAVGAFSQQRTYFIPAAATPVVAAFAQPTVAAYAQPAVQPVMAQQPLVVASQPVVAATPTVVAAAPTYVAAAPTMVATAPTIVAAAPSYVSATPKTDFDIKMNLGLEFAKSVQGNMVGHFGLGRKA